jgi:pyridoxal phosphate enzyme (YggS family)
MAKQPTPTRKPPTLASATSTPAPPPKDTGLIERLASVRERIAKACATARRATDEVTLVAVTKSASLEQIRELVSLGVADLGENRVQQIAQRAVPLNEWHARGITSPGHTLPPKLRWHMIGHLQRNKVRQLLPLVTAIHAIDSLRLAEEIDIAAAKINRRIPVMLQVNASEEPQKYGVAVGAALHLAEQIASMPNLQLAGLMTMAAYDADEKTARFTFSRTREIFEDIKFQKIGGAPFKHLSMGMSGDFEYAIEEGATLIRLGTTLFGTPTRESADLGDEE